MHIYLCIFYTYIYTYIHTCVHTYTYIHHNFFNHSSTKGHFSYFHVSAVINSAPLNVGMLMFF